MPGADDTSVFPIAQSPIAELIRSRDWSSTPLGPPDDWSATLRTSLQNSLSTEVPMSILWGEPLLELYNDSFARLMGRNHPRDFAEPAHKNWRSVWDRCRTSVEAVQCQWRAEHDHGISLLVQRSDGAEELFVSLYFSPLFEPGDHVAGVVITVVDTTREVLARRRFRCLGQLAEATATADNSQQILRRGFQALRAGPDDIPFAALYVQGDALNRAELVDTIHIEPETTWTPAWIDLPVGSSTRDALTKCLIDRTHDVIDLRTLLGPPPPSLDDPVPNRAMIAPLTIGSNGHQAHVGCFIFGINPTLSFDDDYRQFFIEIARKISLNYVTKREHEEQLDIVETWAELTRKKIDARRLRDRAELLDNVGVPFCALDDQFRLVYLNDAARADDHFATRKVLGQKVWTLFPWTEQTELTDCLDRTASHDEPTEVEIESPMNQRCYKVRVFPRQRGLSAVFEDITEWKRYQKDLVDAKERAETMNRLKSNMLTNMSHEIRTPLTSLMGTAHLLAERAPDEFVDHIRKIECNAERVNRTIESVLTLAKIESGELEVSVDRVDLLDETREAVDSLRQLARQRQLRIRLVADAAPCVWADSAFTTSILNNLIGNAIKFTDEGLVEVVVDADDTHGILRVRDTGIGIGEDFLPDVFEEFRQESTGLARSHGGTGIGLTISKRMVEAMDGTISVCSTRGVGSTFTVTLPAANSHPQTTSPGDAEEVSDGRGNTVDTDARPSVLVVEDEAPIRELLVAILDDSFRVTAVDDAAQALDAAEQSEFSLVVMDIGLPDMHGVDALEKLRQIPGYKTRPVLALSGYNPEDDPRLSDHRFDDYLTKPFDPDRLVERLRKFV